jgi:KTSC domain
MRLAELLFEKPVQSTWISDISHNRPGKVLTLKLSNGKSFSIQGISRTTFEQWARSPSKGKFFHLHINGRYKVNRLK